MLLSRALKPLSFYRSIATKMAKIEWAVTIFDKPGADRTAVRPRHVAAIPDAVNAGVFTAAGAIYKDVEKTQFAGSTFHMMAESKEEIAEILKKDIYYEEGIWDIDSIVAYPAGIAVRIAKPMAGVKI
ncbi:hypothetical protein PUMCH_002465 [Australozyma saopauloensis]|uniref:YCII-related domain-containing protein n=1 Tax=Australozyma saopauloensis TaxID=291208 RepID=A0AAX4H9M7_9ASCO|nr:hypothetical protein PUMCH_002465 [[Candida] saopauloensis]